MPGQLLALTSTDPSVADAALSALFANIWHQYTVYPASAHAVPFLIRLTSDRRVFSREAILHLLSCLADGTSYHQVHAGMVPKSEAESADYKAAVEEELRHVRACRRAVIEGLPTYVDLLEDPVPAVRVAAAHLIATVGESANGYLERVVTRAIAEADEAAAVSMILSLPALGAAPATLATLRDKRSAPSTAMVRLALAMAGVRLLQSEASTEDLRLVLHARLHSPTAIGEVLNELWFSGDVAEYAHEVLSLVSPGRLASVSVD